MIRSLRTAGRLVFAAGVVSLVVLALAPPGSAQAERPNVLIIVTDDQRSGMLGVMPRTTNFFQRQGRTYQRAFVTTPLCCPSRATILTGLYAHNHGVVQNGDGHSLPQGVTLQRYLHDAGYTTAMVGKFLNSWRLGRNPSHFDHWVMSRGTRYRDADFNVDGVVRTLQGYATNVVAARAVRLLKGFEATDSQPWFLYVAPPAPHLPATPASRYAGVPVPSWRPNPAVFEFDRSDKPPWVRDKSVPQAWVRAVRADQFRTLMSVDDLVGRLAETLGSLGERRNTIALFLSDNGFLWGEHGLKLKSHPYTQSISIPLLMRWPGHLSPGSQDWRYATTVDLAPTILEAAGVTPLVPMDGRSLLRPWTREHLFTEYYWNRAFAHLPGWASIRTSRMQYIEYYNAERSAVVFREYYRLDRDPWQLTNVLRDGRPANDPPVRGLHDLLRRYRTCAAASCPPVTGA